MILSLLGSLALSSVALSQGPSNAPRDLFRDTGARAFPGIGTDSTALRRRLVEVDLDALAEGRPLRLELFPDATALVRFDAPEPTYGGGLLWNGTVAGDPAASVTLAVLDGTVAGSIRLDARLFRLDYGGNGVHWISESDETAFGTCGIGPEQIVGGGPQRDPGGQGASRAPDVDVMVVYSTIAKNRQGGTSAMLNLINLAVSETNTAYAQSGINQRLTLVHTEEMVGYTEPSSFSLILTHLQSKNDGNLDQVHALRDQYGADVVTMICNNNQFCGIANLMTTVSTSFENRAFCVVNRGCATGYYSFGHEIGHLCGSNHDPANGFGGAYSYSKGYRTPDNRFRTVMAYAPGTRVQRFSSPGATWAGNVMGTASQDNARSHNNTASTVAAFRSGPPAAPVLSAVNFTAGQTASLIVTGAVPASEVYFAYSVTGAGPTLTSFGPVALSLPIMRLQNGLANSVGTATISVPIPAGAAGRTLWLQALNIPGGGVLTNGLQVTVN